MLSEMVTVQGYIGPSTRPVPETGLLPAAEVWLVFLSTESQPRGLIDLDLAPESHQVISPAISGGGCGKASLKSHAQMGV